MKGFVLAAQYTPLNQTANRSINGFDLGEMNKASGLIAEKRTKGSFPSKFETVIYKKQTEKGFGSSVERLIDLSQ